MTIREIINEEIREENNSFLENVFDKQFPSLMFRMAKIIYLLKFEENQHDKNHWKGETKSILKLILSKFGGVRTKQVLIDRINSNKENYYLSINNEFKSKYPQWFKQMGGFLDEQLNELINSYSTKFIDWLFTSFVKTRTLDKESRDLEIANCSQEFIDENF